MATFSEKFRFRRNVKQWAAGFIGLINPVSRKYCPNAIARIIKIVMLICIAVIITSALSIAGRFGFPPGIAINRFIGNLGCADAQYCEAQRLFDASCFEDSLEWYKKSSTENYLDSYIGVGNSLFELGRLEEARDWYQRAADDGQWKGYAGLANCASSSRDYGTACAMYDKALELEGDVPGDIVAQANYNAGDFERALLEFQNDYEKTGSAESAEGVGDCFVALGDKEQGASWYRTAIECGSETAASALSEIGY